MRDAAGPDRRAAAAVLIGVGTGPISALGFAARLPRLGGNASAGPWALPSSAVNSGIAGGPLLVATLATFTYGCAHSEPCSLSARRSPSRGAAAPGTTTGRSNAESRGGFAQ